MKIALDLSLLKTAGLTPDEFIILYIHYKKMFNHLNIYDEQTLTMYLEILKTKGWIEDQKVSDKFLNLFVSDFDSMFEELVNLYPHKVKTSRSLRVLRAKDASAASNNKARNKYKKVIGKSAHLHRYIISCLKKQLIVEKDNLAYMQNFETWINNHTWEKYEDVNLKNSEDDRRITRKL
tara:strand:- start:1573 stop:2109 length:537 start_codon:yes stop_codon:yes gene_type:complete